MSEQTKTVWRTVVHYQDGRAVPVWPRYSTKESALGWIDFVLKAYPNRTVKIQRQTVPANKGAWE